MMTTSMSVLLLLGICFGTALSDFCTESPCSESRYCISLSDKALCIEKGYRQGNCSINAKLTCDENAQCVDSDDHTGFKCDCIGEAQGDGIREDKSGTGCKLSYKPCKTDVDCPEFGFCEKVSLRCQCKIGFIGDGFNCTDIDECPADCHTNAICTNTDGSYDCTCDGALNYKGDGKTCTLSCNNDNDCDAPRAYCDDDFQCQCKTGFISVENDLCQDINECEGVNDCPSGSMCVNNEGGYSCKCKNGFFGDGKLCKALPKNCNEIPNMQTKNIYVIDPDGTGPAGAFEVECDTIKGIVVTKINPIDKLPADATYGVTEVGVEYDGKPEDLQTFVNNSAYCFQDITFMCYRQFAFFPYTEWHDVFGNVHKNWGTDKDFQCGCGAVGKCDRCYCNGHQTGWLTTEEGRIVDKTKLPFMKMVFMEEIKGNRKGRMDIGAMICADVPVGLPLDCDDAKKNYAVTKNTPMNIDTDGAGDTPSMLVFCDVESYEHVGITEIPADESKVTPTTGDEIDLTYVVPVDGMRALIEGSVFCSQEIVFICRTSPLLGSNGGYIVGPTRKLEYFPGANGEQGMCGCGATRSCLSKEVTCNCNVPGLTSAADFGLIIDKSDLPALKVRANIDNGRGQYRVGPLKCSQAQFGIEPNCEKYRSVGKEKDYSYFIDSDGPGGLDPFLVECKFKDNPPMGETIVHHEQEDSNNVDGPYFDLSYLQVSADQIAALKDRSTFCTQNVEFTCNKVKVDADSLSYTPANQTAAVDVMSILNACKDGDCNCDGLGSAKDDGVLSDLGYVPIQKMDFRDIEAQLASGGSAGIKIGPMVCSEIFPSCEHLQRFVKSDLAVAGEGAVVNGKFTIDPDGAGGVDPFSVSCMFPKTLVHIYSSSGGGVTPVDENTAGERCFKINYKSASDSSISDAQINALAAISGNCRQELSLECNNAPASGNINFTSCDGKAQTGWGGSYGVDKCACGVNGICDGGRDAKCNCDMNDGVTRYDKGTIYDNSRLPICEVCLRVASKAPTEDNPSPSSILKYRVGQLSCDGHPGTRGDCQTSRRHYKVGFKEGQEATDVATTLSFGKTHAPVACRYYRKPPVGELLIRPSRTTYSTPPEETVDTKIDYIVININIIGTVTQRHEYCRQKVYLFCLKNQLVDVGGNYGFYDRNGNMPDFFEMADDSEDVLNACQENQELCNLCGHPKGFLLTEKSFLPVASIILNVKGVTVVVGNLECLNIKRSCQHMMDSGNTNFGYVENSKYLIDPDAAFENIPFLVQCAHNKKDKLSTTIVKKSGQWTGTVIVKDKSEPGKFKIPVEYNGVSSKQIKGLTDISEFCWQGIQYNCRRTPLMSEGANPSYYSLSGFNGQPAPSFGTGDKDYNGCACGLLGTCIYPNVTCNCDAMGPMGSDQGAVSDKDVLPIEAMTVGGQGEDAKVSITVGDVRCAVKPVEPPRDCNHVHQLGKAYGFYYTKSGEYLISPDPKNANSVPFMVFCDFDNFPNRPVTVIKPRPIEKQPFPDPNETVKVVYQGPDPTQIRALIAESAYCYQGVRIDCRGSVLLKNRAYFNSAGSNQKNYFWGGGEPRGNNGGVCACGKDGLCGGLDSRDGQRLRKCNCDYGDDTFRADAGVFYQKDYLPLSEFFFVNPNTEQDVNITIGDLYCADDPLEFDECALNLHDCHPMAVCVDQKDGYLCRCQKGWEGKTTSTDKTLPRANGRQCIDDDECSWNPCPRSATCANTEGSFTCTCKKGYRQVDPMTCEDINECADPALNECHENARCQNLQGSYRCACKRGFKGNGKECSPVGICSCFGDPHCQSFDKRWLHFQGSCEYTMARDNCEDDGEPSFHVSIKHWKRNSLKPGYFSWVKSVSVFVETLDIVLDQGGEIFVGGISTTQLVIKGVLSVLKERQYVTLIHKSGLEIKWDGVDGVDVTIPPSMKGGVCGLCGNYNGDPKDDWTVGPMCEETAGTITQNFELLGQSWTYGFEECDVDCDPEMPVYPKECENQRLIEKKCDAIFNKITSPFKSCLYLMDDDEVEVLKTSCEYDLCYVEDDFNKDICKTAETLYTRCLREFNHVVVNWRNDIEECQDIDCGNNMMYKTCGPVNPDVCIPDEMLMQQSQNENCREGCFCAEGMVMDVDRCVPKEDCGCIYQDTYLQKGDEILTYDCRYKIKCLGNYDIEKSEAACGDNQECTLLDSVVGCYCTEGFEMAADGLSCSRDPCKGVECTVPNQECVEGVCQCLMGYVGDCNQCLNVDECLTGLANCNKIGQKCIDTDGSFRCECEKGFIKTFAGCQDIDECAIFSETCGANSECSNTLGGYECECCAGYLKNKNDECVRDRSIPTGGKCCSCQGDRCSESGEICGTDGITYKDYRTFVVATCRDAAKNDVKINYKGKCKSTCEVITCSKQFAVCQMEDGIPTCNCPTCEDSTIVTMDQTVCATNKITYKSVCHMKAASCEAELETEIEVETFGRPCGEGPGVVVGPWGAWGPCSERCQQGVRSRSRTVPPDSTISSVVTVPCFNTCPEGPCNINTCTGPSEVCYVDGTGKPSCTCMDCSEYPEELICARLGNVIQTYLSDCELKAAACKAGQRDYEILVPRACEAKPINCTVSYNFMQPRDDNDCVSTRSINMGVCDGGCDQAGELCCYGDKTQEKVVIMQCPDGSKHRKTVDTITGCNCLTKTEVEARNNMDMTIAG